MRVSAIQRDFELLMEQCEDKRCTTELIKTMQCKCGHDAMRKWFLKITRKLVESPNATMWTIMLERDEFTAGELKNFNIVNSKRAIARIINSNRIIGLRAIGYLDIQLQEPLQDISLQKPIWLMHYHFIVCSNLKPEKLKRIMSKKFANISSKSRPLFIKAINKTREFNHSYFIKYPWEMKKKIKSKNGSQYIRPMRIKGALRGELMAFLAQSQLIKWIFLIGWRRASGTLVCLNPVFNQ